MPEQCNRYNSCPVPQQIRALELEPGEQYKLLSIATRTLVLGKCTGYNPDAPGGCNNELNADGSVTRSLVELGTKMAAVRVGFAKLLASVVEQERALLEAERLAQQNNSSIS